MDEQKDLEQPKERTELEKQVDIETIVKGPEVIKDFDETKTIKVPGKKDRKLKPRSYYCSTCRQWFLEDKSDKRPMGYDRNEDGSMTMKSTRFSVFCPSCSKFISIIDPETDAKIKDAIDKVGNK